MPGMTRRHATAASNEPAKRALRGNLLSLPWAPLLPLLLFSGCQEGNRPDSESPAPPGSAQTEPPRPSTGPPSPPPAGERHLLAYRNAIYKPGTRLEFNRVVNVRDAKVLVVSPKEKLTGTTRSTQTLTFIVDIVSEQRVEVLVQTDREEGTQSIGPNLKPLRQRVGILEGKTVIFNLRDAEWSPELDQRQVKGGASVIRFVREILARKSDSLLYGLSPRAVGESWTADPRHVPALGGAREKATGSGAMRLEFRGVEKEHGTDCAILVGRVNITSSDALTGKTTREGTIRVARSLTHLADLSVAFDGQMEVTGSPATGLSISTTGPYEMTQQLRITAPAGNAESP